eukprot:TRINITY_DN8791_c0_g1_i1.p1 TRINITY_DN8791_c0_g1~~TRINITY_DN8791_c0_g1_i1.p1  ORF type:complete len:144 (-),score=26.36 TRINITY_DN8791_c0_g1_i1:5-436(-)
MEGNFRFLVLFCILVLANAAPQQSCTTALTLLNTTITFDFASQPPANWYNLFFNGTSSVATAGVTFTVQSTYPQNFLQVVYPGSRDRSSFSGESGLGDVDYTAFNLRFRYTGPTGVYNVTLLATWTGCNASFPLRLNVTRTLR